MNAPILAQDIMVTKLVTLRPEMDLRDAARLLVKHRISGAPVVDDAGRLIGVFTEKDVMTALIDAVYDELPCSEVGAYMVIDPLTITEDVDLLSIAQIFKANTFRRLPVVRGEELVGQISRRDILRTVARLIDPAPDHKTAYLYLSALRSSDEPPFA
jgi:CBS domain-containing protein